MTPSTAIQRPDLGLALLEFDLAMSEAGFIAQKIFPVIDVALASANFSRVKAKELVSGAATGRAPGAEYNQIQTNFEQDFYATVENGITGPVDDNEANIYAYTGVDAELLTAMRVRDVILRNLEERVAKVVFNTTTFTGSQATPVSIPWSTKATAMPIDDVDAASKSVYLAYGVRPNTLVINWLDYKNLRACAQIIEKIKYSGRDDPKNVTAQMLAEIFEIEQVLVADALYNAANTGQTLNFSPVWTSGSAMLCRAARTADLREPCLGRIFSYTGDGGSVNGTFEEYRHEIARATHIRCRHQTAEKLINKEAGNLITGI